MSDLPMTGGGINVRTSGMIRQADRNRNLWDLAQDYIRKELREAPHQRDVTAWGTKKRRAWIKRIRNCVENGAPQPLGSICTYTLSGDATATEYINDGLQRIHATVEAIEKPSIYGLAEDAIKKICKSVTLPIQPRIYETHKEAADDFCCVNDGTSLEPAEQHKWILVYAKAWDTIWRFQMEQWRKVVDHSLSSFCKSTGFRKQRLASERSNHHLFAVAMCGRPANFGKGSQLEEIVVDCFEHYNPDEVRKAMRSIRDYAAEIESSWRKLNPHPAKMMHASLARWCLGVRVLYNAQTTPNFWIEFFDTLFERTKGQARLAARDNNFWQLTKRLELFPHICKELGFPAPLKPERKRPKDLLKHGYSADHLFSFSDFGEGNTEPMPSRQNSAKNARRPLQEIEKDIQEDSK